MKESVQAGLVRTCALSAAWWGRAARMDPAQAGALGCWARPPPTPRPWRKQRLHGQDCGRPYRGQLRISARALLAAQEEMGFSEDDLVMALFAAAAVGRVIALSATISGAQGGCQAESGSAAAMTAAALVQLYGGTPKQACDAGGFALMNMMGLVCDPVHGLVEVPCVYRNVGGVAQALAAAQMALSGIPCPIPFDQLIAAMKDVGESMPPSLRETGEGGCGSCAGCG